MTLKQKLAIRYIRAKFKILSSISKKKAAEKAFELFCTPQSRNTKALPLVFKNAEKLQFRFQQFQIAGYRCNKGAPQKALIVHGFESSVVNFDRYANALIKKGYEVLAFDAPAHGRSTGRQVNAMIYYELLKFVYKSYGPVQTFIAHSFGGLVTSMFLAETQHNASTRLVLIAPATETQTAINRFFHFTGISDEEVKNEFDRIITSVGGHPVAWFSITRAMKNIKARVLWIHDKDDKITPVTDAYKLKKANYSNIHFVITKGLGHRRIYRDAEVVGKIVEFV